jgi:hypothetical protein
VSLRGQGRARRQWGRHLSLDTHKTEGPWRQVRHCWAQRLHLPLHAVRRQVGYGHSCHGFSLKDQLVNITEKALIPATGRAICELMTYLHNCQHLTVAGQTRPRLAMCKVHCNMYSRTLSWDILEGNRRTELACILHDSAISDNAQALLCAAASSGGGAESGVRAATVEEALIHASCTKQPVLRNARMSNSPVRLNLSRRVRTQTDSCAGQRAAAVQRVLAAAPVDPRQQGHGTYRDDSKRGRLHLQNDGFDIDRTMDLIRSETRQRRRQSGFALATTDRESSYSCIDDCKVAQWLLSCASGI